MEMQRGLIMYYENGKFIKKEFPITDTIQSDSKGVLFPSNLFDFKNISNVDTQISSLFNSQTKELFILPGFVDVHVHLREPGFSYKETIKTGTEAAAAGGFTAVCSMPNLNPAPDCIENLKVQTDIIEKDAKVHVYPYGCITKGSKGQELSDMEELAEHVIAFTDDGNGVQDDSMMEKAMIKAKSLGKKIVAHCEDKRYGTTPESEYIQLERDLKLAAKTGCSYHLCHASTKESVQLIKEAKKAGLPVTAETAPHYIMFSEEDVKDSGDYKMNPPIRRKKDQEALIQGICDGTIDMIATDHAPHSHEEKSKGFQNSLNGIVGLETAFAVIYTQLVKSGIISMEKLVEIMSENARKIFKIPQEAEDAVIVDLGHLTVNRNTFRTMGRSMPYEGLNLYGKCVATYINGRMVR